jgi:hypothetical protein
MDYWTNGGDFRTNLHYSEILLSYFNPTTESEILEVIGGLRPNTAVSYNGILAKFLKKYLTTLAPKISLLINDCLKRGAFPIPLKLQWSRLSSKLAVGKFSNYRPASVLAAISKTFGGT